jgi:hypothetical protein
MRTFIRDLLDRIAKATVIANTGNLGEALREFEEQRLIELDIRHARALRTAAWKSMHRPQRMPGREPLPATRRRERSHLIAAH